MSEDEVRPIRRRIEIPELQGDSQPWKTPGDLLKEKIVPGVQRVLLRARGPVMEASLGAAARRENRPGRLGRGD